VSWDFGGWFSRIWSVFAVSWRQLLPVQIAVLAVGLVLVLSLRALGFLLGFSLGVTPGATGPSPETSPDQLATVAVIAPALAFVIGVISIVVQSIAAGAGQWVVARSAAGLDAPFAGALRFGGRRFGPMLGWSLLGGLAVALGLLACVLPGLYLAVATALIVPVVAFEGRNGLARSFSLVHRDFGSNLGRIALGILGYVVVVVPLNLVAALLAGVVGGGNPIIIQLIGDVLWAVIGVPLALVYAAFLAVTYAGARVKEEPGLSTGQLVAELDR